MLSTDTDQYFKKKLRVEGGKTITHTLVFKVYTNMDLGIVKWGFEKKKGNPKNSINLKK